MPVRKIPKNYRSITGFFPSLKNGRGMAFESSLERDFFLTLEFDPAVDEYEEQPLKLSGMNGTKKVEYTPDCLITFYGAKNRLLVEVKYIEDLEKNSAEYEPRFALARNFVRENDMEFKIFTEKEIRGDGARLENYRLLYRFTKPPLNIEECTDPILKIVASSKTIKFSELLEKLSTERTVQAKFTPVIWHLLLTRKLEADLDKTIGYSTVIRISYGNSLP